MNNRLILNNEVIYKKDYLSFLEKIFSGLIKKINNFGYEECYSNSLNEELLFNISDKIIYKNITELTIISIFDDEIKARAEMINLLKIYCDYIFDLTYIKLINGYLNNEDNFVAGFYDIEHKFIKCFKGKIEYKNGKYYNHIYINEQIVYIIESIYNEYKIISPNIKDNYIGGVLLDKDDVKSKEIKKELIDIFNTKFININSASKQYEYLEDNGYLYIVEIRKGGKLRIKCLCLDIYTSIDSFNSIKLFIGNNNINLIKKLKKITLEKQIIELKNNTISICENCLDKFDNYLIPFNQKLKKQCNYCENNPFLNVILL